MPQQQIRTHLDTLSRKRGFTLLIAILVVGLVLAIGLSILTITLKEYLLAGVAKQSVIALSAADAGLECGFFWDQNPTDGNKFDVVGESTAPPLGTPFSCMGVSPSPTTQGAISGALQEFQFTWGTVPNQVCAKVTVIKHYNAGADISMPIGDCRSQPQNCPKGAECTCIVSRGYDKACTNLSGPRTVERALRAEL